MAWVSEFLRRLRIRFRGEQFDRDLDEEMRLHMELRAADKRAAGMPEEAAAAAARRQFGNATQIQERSREAWGWTFLDVLRQDLRYAARALAANPGFTATALLSLALGIGANVAVFSIINAVMLRSLPVADPEKLVLLKLGEGADEWLSTTIWEQVRAHQQSFSGVLAYSTERFDTAEGGESRPVDGLWVSGDFFRVLGIAPMMGRAFTAQDDRWGGGPEGAVAVIGYQFWKQNFGGDPSVIGKTISLNRRRFMVVGVTPPWFTGLEVDRSYDVAIPIGCQPMFHDPGRKPNEAYHWWLRILGRIAAGESLQQADDRLRSITPEIMRATATPDRSPKDQESYLQSRFRLLPAGSGFSQTRVQYKTALFVLMTTVGLVLLIACANIANLLLARAAVRQRELSVRMAIGAGRLRVIRQLMTESLLLAMLGTAAGFVFALWGSRVLVRLLSTSRSPLEIDVAPDLRLLAFTVGVAVLTAVLFGLAPAIRATGAGLNHVLKENVRGSIKGFTRLTMGKVLVSGQVALSLILLVGAGLFLGTLRNLMTADTGFDRRNILLVNVDLPRSSSVQQRNASLRDTLERLRSLPGVVSVASMALTPISPEGWAQPVAPEGFTPQSPADVRLFFNRVSSGYFETMRTPVVMGREFNEHDDANSLPVIVINQEAAKRFFGSANPLGKTMGLSKPGRRGEKELYHVIGVVKDTRYNRIDEPVRRIGYLAATQDGRPGAGFRYAVRSRGPVEEVIPSIRGAVSSVNRDAALEFRNFETQVKESILQPQVVALLSSIFGLLALMLAMIGLYGITTYAVARRRSEIGIRMALGAQRQSVMWMMLRDVAVLAAAGISIGTAASLAAGQLVTKLLYGVRPNDPLQLTGAAVLLAAAIAIAAYVPAWRAARLDPMTALREE